MKAVILLSGGQDSTTCLYWAKKQFSDIYAIGFDYGQKHGIELNMALTIAERLNVQYKIIDVKGLLNTNNETDFRITTGRNALFLTIAASLFDVDNIVAGFCQMDFQGYPDCRQSFVDSQRLTLSLALDKDIKIHTPLMHKTKAETWKMAKELNCLDVIINDTMTDYNGSIVKNEWGYGINNNHATELRIQGFYEAKQNGWI